MLTQLFYLLTLSLAEFFFSSNRNSSACGSCGTKIPSEWLNYSTIREPYNTQYHPKATDLLSISCFASQSLLFDVRYFTSPKNLLFTHAFAIRRRSYDAIFCVHMNTEHYLLWSGKLERMQLYWWYRLIRRSHDVIISWTSGDCSIHT